MACASAIAGRRRPHRRLTQPGARADRSPIMNRATLLGEVEVGTFRLDESDLIAVKAFADGATA